MHKKTRGFTLIELLVVIAIIGVLAGIVLVSLASSRSKARDAKRIADIREVVNALELYANDQGGYPVATGIIEGNGLDETGWGPNPTGAHIYITAVNAAPLPPDGGCDATDNQYQYDGTDTTFTVTTCLGNPTSDFQDNNGDGKIILTGSHGGLSAD